jgi:hypothetical protein
MPRRPRGPEHLSDETQRAEAAAQRRRRQVVMSALVLVVAVIGVWITAATGRRDAAVLFVGLPALLALAIALLPPARSLHGAVASITTFALLLASILLQEGAICVLLSAPLVFAVTHSVAAMVRRFERRQQGALLLPIVLILSLEGVLPGWRIAPNQTVEATATVEGGNAEVVARLAEGPDFTEARKPLLLRTGMPVPDQAAGAGLEPGDQWTFDYRGAPIVTEVTSRVQNGGDGEVAFTVVHDGAKTARWLTWQDASLRWSDNGDGTTDVAIGITFERGLDPSWWFGPIESGFVGAAAEYLLDAVVDDRVDR